MHAHSRHDAVRDDQAAVRAAPAPGESFRDDRDRRIDVEAYGDGPLDGDREGLVDMYARFDTADRAQGLPPLDGAARGRWLDQVLSGSNVLAWHRDRAVGHAALLADGRGSHELVVFVDSPAQGAGVGSALLGALLRAARDGDVARVRLSVEPSNRAAVALYRKFGFEVVAESPMELEMARDL
ncbi:MAG: N-acetyltransferase family protein [Haloferacaceae archaeon]